MERALPPDQIRASLDGIFLMVHKVQSSDSVHYSQVETWSYNKYTYAASEEDLAKQYWRVIFIYRLEDG